MVLARLVLQLSKRHTQKLRQGEQRFLYATHPLYLIHIPIKFHEDIPSFYRVMGCTRMKITQNKHKNN